MSQTQDRGFYEPECSTINFAVPSLSSIQSSPKVLPVDVIAPGMLIPVVEIVKDASMLTPSAFKLCVDGV